MRIFCWGETPAAGGYRPGQLSLEIRLFSETLFWQKNTCGMRDTPTGFKTEIAIQSMFGRVDSEPQNQPKVNSLRLFFDENNLDMVTITLLIFWSAR